MTPLCSLQTTTKNHVCTSTTPDMSSKSPYERRHHFHHSWGGWDLWCSWQKALNCEATMLWALLYHEMEGLRRCCACTTSDSSFSNCWGRSSNPITLCLELANDYHAREGEEARWYERRIESDEEKKNVKWDELPYAGIIGGVDFRWIATNSHGQTYHQWY